MKRSPELRDLSEDHHYGLVLARKAMRAAVGEGALSLEEAWTMVEEKFADELEPHFQVEERALVPLLEQHGEEKLTERLRVEHAALRRFLAPGQARTAEELEGFGKLLEKHIRFEEREVFVFAQAKLSKEELSTVRQARRSDYS